MLNVIYPVRREILSFMPWRIKNILCEKTFYDRKKLHIMIVIGISSHKLNPQLCSLFTYERQFPNRRVFNTEQKGQCLVN